MVVRSFGVLFRHLYGQTEEFHENLSQKGTKPAKIWTKRLPNKSRLRNHMNQLGPSANMEDGQ
jgi:hypothetical protein